MLNIVNLDRVNLKPCPYCGGEAYIAFFNGRNPYIDCKHTKKCYMRPSTFLMSAERLSKQIKAWNMREEDNYKSNYYDSLNRIKPETEPVDLTNINVGKEDMATLFKIYEEYSKDEKAQANLTFPEWAVNRYNNYD